MGFAFVIPAFESLEQRLLLTASPIASWQSDDIEVVPASSTQVTGLVLDGSDWQTYHFKPTAQGQVVIDMVGDATLDSCLQLYNGKRMLLHSDNVGGTLHSRLTFNVVPGMDYYVRAGSAQGTTGAYTLTIASTANDDFGDSFDAASSVTLSRKGKLTVSGKINSLGDEDVFSLTAASSGRLTIDLSEVGRTVRSNSQFAVYDSNQDLVASVSDPNTRSLTLTATAGDQYYVVVSGMGGTYASYRLVITDDSTSSSGGGGGSNIVLPDPPPTPPSGGDSGGGGGDDVLPPVPPATVYGPRVTAFGGGIGYTHTISVAQATVSVDTWDELVTAIGAAHDGDIIYITHDIALNDGDIGRWVSINVSVTIAGSRGLMPDDQVPAFTYSALTSNGCAAFRVTGGSVRFTGLKFIGAYTDWQLMPGGVRREAGAISSTGASTVLEVDNCEFSGWSYAAVYVMGGTVTLHDSDINHVQQTGYGYGLVLAGDGTRATVYNCSFDYVRHAIASTHDATYYEAYDNYLGPNAPSDSPHSFDAHTDSGTGVSNGSFSIHNNRVMQTAYYAFYSDGVPRSQSYIEYNQFARSESTAIYLARIDPLIQVDNNEFDYTG